MSMSRYPANQQAAVNGVILHYAVVGEGKPVILLHGNGETHDLFDVEIDQLQRAGYRVYAPDSRGHGVNEQVTEYHYADMAEDIFQLICLLGLQKPALYGHSDGGIIGLLLELTHPGTLGLLAISGTNLSPEGLEPSFLAECAASHAQRPDPLLALMLTEPHIAPSELERMTIPVLVTAGSNDLIRPEETRRIAAHLPKGKLIVVEGADHGSYIQGSPVMGRLLIEFLGQYDGFS